MTFKEIRMKSGMNKTKFAEYFGIPYRSVQNWEMEISRCPEYLLKLMQYKLEKEKGKEKQITFEEIKAMNHIITSGGEFEYYSIYENEKTGEQYLTTSDDECEVIYICKVLN